MRTVVSGLEELAKSIRSNLDDHEGPTPLSLLEREIAFWSEHLDRVREVQEDMMRGILRAECDVGTDLLALESYAPQVFLIRFKARDNLKNKLLQLDVERRRLITSHERDVAHLHERLLHLVSQRAQLKS